MNHVRLDAHGVGSLRVKSGIQWRWRPDVSLRKRQWTRVVAVSALVVGMLGGTYVLRAQAQERTQAAGETAAVPTQIEFNRDVRPILSDKCYKCHGPGTQEAGLRLDEEKAAKAQPESGLYAIVPGDLDASGLMYLVTSDDPGERMPRKAEPLTKGEVEVLRRWIAQGAKWQGHWSFEQPERPAVPKVSRSSWVRNPIDAFVLARLDKEGLKP